MGDAWCLLEQVVAEALRRHLGLQKRHVVPARSDHAGSDWLGCRSRKMSKHTKTLQDHPTLRFFVCFGGEAMVLGLPIHPFFKTRWKPRTRMYSRSWTTSANLCNRKTHLFCMHRALISSQRRHLSNSSKRDN